MFSTCCAVVAREAMDADLSLCCCTCFHPFLLADYIARCSFGNGFFLGGAAVLRVPRGLPLAEATEARPAAASRVGLSPIASGKERGQA